MPDLPAAPALATLDEWIAREAIPFSMESTEATDAAVDRMVGALGDSVDLLGFGEALHGGEEILLLRNRLFQRLVRAHGYCAIAIESSFPRGRLVNDFVLGRGPDIYDVVREAGFGHGFGSVEANRELVEWMRAYNADPANASKLHFYGFDMPNVTSAPASPRQVLDFALDYLASIDADVGRVHRERIAPHLGEDADWENVMAWHDPAQSARLLSAVAALRLETEDVISQLRTRRPAGVAQSGEHAFAEALHYAGVARQLLNFYVAMAGGSDYAASLGVRDVLMADNLEYVVARERGRGKVLAFAHNKHLQRGQAKWQLGPTTIAWWPAGAHLKQSLGSRYAAIGSAVGVSEANGIGRPEEGSLEARLTASPGPIRLIPTHGGEPAVRPPVEGMPVRSGSVRNPTYFPLTAESFADFDWLAVLDSITYTRGGRPLPPA